MNLASRSVVRVVDGQSATGAPTSETFDAPIAVSVFDPNPLSLSGLVSILRGERDFQVSGQFSDPQACLESARDSAADVVLVDVDSMPAALSAVLVQELSSASGDGGPYVAVMSMSEIDAAFQALKSGARGVILKSSPAAQLAVEVRTVARGGVVLPAAMVQSLLSRFVPGGPDTETGAPGGGIGLTARQRDVLALVARGLSNAEIADTLCVSRSTVKSHISAMLRSLGLRDRTQLVVYAHRVPDSE